MRLNRGVLEVRIWLASASLPSSDQGIRLDEWEPIDLQITPDFPSQAPIASTGRDDFPKLPHQPQGSGFCVRVASSDWNPSAGMQGFLHAVVSAYANIALGTLEGKLQPWHPLEHVLSEEGCVVVKIDWPQADQTFPGALLRWAVSVKAHKDRADIIGWLDFRNNIDSAAELTLALTEQLTEVRAVTPGAFLVPVIIASQPTTFEYFDNLDKLLKWGKPQGIERDELLSHIISSARANQNSGNHRDPGKLDPCMLLGRAFADTQFTLVARDVRFAAAKLDLGTVERAATVHFDETSDPPIPFTTLFPWVEVYDGRPEILRRRASGRAVSKLAGLRLLVLGGGALGAPIAEHCVRAGAAQVHIVDSDRVSPGILTRQPYEEADIGRPKATVLANRLARIYPETRVTASNINILVSGTLTGENLSAYDLIIDATANRSVAVKIEQSRREEHAPWPPLITVAINQRATHGFAAVTPRGSIGAGIDLQRRLGLACCANPALTDVDSAFFPQQAERISFRPEPGCSDSTFIGSSTDVAALAAQLLDSGAGCLDLPAAPAHLSPGQRSLSIVRLGANQERRPARVVLSGPDDLVVQDSRNVCQIRIDVRTMRRIRGLVGASLDAGPEAGAGWTGGLLLGEFDDACGIAWVSWATRLPPNGTVDPLDMKLDVQVVSELLDRYKQLSKGMITLIGFWKTHLGGAPTVGGEDRQAMKNMVSKPERPPRMLLLVLGLPEGEPAGDPRAPWDPSMRAEVFTA